MNAILNSQYRALQYSLCQSVDHFRKGADQKGLDAFLNSLDDLEAIVQACVYLQNLHIVDDVLPLMQRIKDAVENEDIVVITDLMEFTLYPLTEKWLEETKENEGSTGK